MDEQGAGTLLTPKEVARRLGVQVKTLANWRTQGIGPRPFVMVSAKAVRYPEDAVARFLAERTVGAAPAGDDEQDDDAPFGIAPIDAERATMERGSDDDFDDDVPEHNGNADA